MWNTYSAPLIPYPAHVGLPDDDMQKHYVPTLLPQCDIRRLGALFSYLLASGRMLGCLVHHDVLRLRPWRRVPWHGANVRHGDPLT